MEMNEKAVAKLIFEANHSDEAEEILREYIRDRYEAREILQDKVTPIRPTTSKQVSLAAVYSDRSGWRT
jgi:hypothetical protein